LLFDAGTWQPPEDCYKLPGPLRLRVFRNNRGVIVYGIAVSGRRVAELVTVLGMAWVIKNVPTIARQLALVAQTGELAAVGARGASLARGALATAGAVTEAGAATGGGALATAGVTAEAGAVGGGTLAGAGAVATVALPVIVMAGVWLGLGAGYAAARKEARNENAARGFSYGFVMAVLGWSWSQAVERFGQFSATPTPEDEALRVIRANAFNRGLRAGFQAGANLADSDRTAYQDAIKEQARINTNTHPPRAWTRRTQIDYVIDLAAAARKHFLRPE
jgi:hypothetical protein